MRKKRPISLGGPPTAQFRPFLKKSVPLGLKVSGGRRSGRVMGVVVGQAQVGVGQKGGGGGDGGKMEAGRHA